MYYEFVWILFLCFHDIGEKVADLRQQEIITLGTIMDNYLFDKVIVFYSCLDLFEHNVLLTLTQCIIVLGVGFRSSLNFDA